MALLLDLYGFVSVILHGLLLTAQALVLGGIAFQGLVAGPLAAKLGPAGAASARRCRRLVCWSALALGAVLAASVAIEAAILADTLARPLREALSAPFARAGLAELCAALAAAALSLRGGPGRGVGLWLAGLAILASAMATTHAAARLEARSALLAATALHCGAASVWIGGLPYLGVALATCRGAGAWVRIGRRFSRLAASCVAALVASGTFLSWRYIGSLDALYGTAYGVMVSVKVLLLIGLLGLGAMNLRTIERLRRDPRAPALRLRRFAEVELGVGIAVFFIAASLTSLPPAVDLVSGRATLEQIAERLAPRWPSLRSPESSSLGLQALQAHLDAEAHAARSQAAPAHVPGGGLPPPRNAANVAWSEYNHHWAGIAVLAIGLLTLLERSGRARLARHWPLLFLPLAAFLSYRDSVESGLFASVGALEALRDPEWVQHQVFYVLVAAFGVFEWRVRTGRTRSTAAALVFPLLSAVASGLLLTHAHLLSNARELLLIEITHVPLALLGTATAWARWLELRLPPPDSRVAGWVWRTCFALVGVSLLLYRES